MRNIRLPLAISVRESSVQSENVEGVPVPVMQFHMALQETLKFHTLDGMN